MRRNMDLVRVILTKVQDEELRDAMYIPIEGYTEDEVKAHIAMLFQAGYIQGIPAGAGADRYLAVWVKELSWMGHDFLSATGDSNIWERVKDTVMDKGGAFTVDMLIALARQFIAGNLGLPMQKRHERP